MTTPLPTGGELRASGRLAGVTGNVVNVEFDGDIRQGEVAEVRLGELRLKSEVVRLRGRRADLQVFESTDGLRVGDPVEFTGEQLSAQLGPGLLGQLYDGLQNPLERLAEEAGFFLPRGHAAPALDPARLWQFTPVAKPGDEVAAGDRIGEVPEGTLTHAVMVPFGWRGRGRVAEVAGAGSYRVDEPVAVVEDAEGRRRELTMSFRWPVKRAARLYRERLAPVEPLITQIRLIDSMFPVALGGTYCIPGPFGAGKTVLQQITSRFARVDVVVVAACGERAAEVVEIIRDFPALQDPATGRSLMERTIIICNTSSMPVAARESSVYTAVTLAEYYRQMGLQVLLLADSTSRWAQAMRERSGRLEEIPGEEAFPAYLESVVAEFYERAGRVRLRDGRVGSVTIGGTISPAGGNFEEPVTQATLKVVGAFHALSRERSDARRYPAIDPLESWSTYEGIIATERRRQVRQLLQRARDIEQMMKVVGEEGTALPDYVLHLKGELFDAVYLQQNAFDPVDAATPRERQLEVFTLLEEILLLPLRLAGQEEARGFFHRLRLHFLDWNGMPWGSDAYAAQRERIRAFVQEKAEPKPGMAGSAPLGRGALVESELDADIARARRMRVSGKQELRLGGDDEADRDQD